MSEKIFLTSLLILTVGALARWFVGDTDVPIWFKATVLFLVFGGAFGAFTSIIYRIWA